MSTEFDLFYGTTDEKENDLISLGAAEAFGTESLSALFSGEETEERGFSFEALTSPQRVFVALPPASVAGAGISTETSAPGAGQTLRSVSMPNESSISRDIVYIVGAGADPDAGTFESFEQVMATDPDYTGKIAVQIPGGGTTTFPLAEHTTTFKGYFFGGPGVDQSGDTIEYDSKVILSGGVTGPCRYKVLAGGACITIGKGELCTVRGSSSVTIDRDDVEFSKIVCGGCIVFGGTVTSYADTELSISGGLYKSFVVGGCAVGGTAGDDTTVICKANTSTLRISGGTFMNAVAAGACNQNGTAKGVDSPVHTLDISGGTFHRMVCGGNISNTKDFCKEIGQTSTTPIDLIGNSVKITVTVDTSQNDVIFSNGLVAGSCGKGKIAGSTSVTFTGDSDRLQFAGGTNNYVIGDSADAGNGQYRRTNFSELKFSGYSKSDGSSGDFSPQQIYGFDSISVSDHSKVTLDNGTDEGFDLSTVTCWNIDATSTLTWKYGTNDMQGATMNISLNGNDLSTPWTIIDGTSDTLSGWSHLTGGVSIGGETAEWQNSCYRSANYQLYLEWERGVPERQLVVSKIG
ncbi:MAG: hypothetical protein MJ016_04195 [Victivallaceae bacterium]|nr:hypothetical protein [Victivallaceae bacterium]